MIIGYCSGILLKLLVWGVMLLGLINSSILIIIAWGMFWKLNTFHNGAFKFRVGLIIAHLFGIVIEVVWVLTAFFIFVMFKAFLFSSFLITDEVKFTSSFLMLGDIGYILVFILQIVLFAFLVFWYRLYIKYW